MFNRWKNTMWFNYAMLLAGVLCISWSAILVKIANVSGLSSGFYRMFFGALVLMPFWLAYRKPINSLRGLKVAMLCGVFFALDIALWNTSIMLSKASVSTLLANLAPVWVGLGAIFILKEKPKRIFWIGTVISLVGVVVIVGYEALFSSKINIGNILAIAASMFYGAYLLTVRKGRNSMDTFNFTMVSMLASVVVLALLMLFWGESFGNYEPKAWWALLALGVVPQVLGWLAINQALGHIKPTIASVSLLSQTVFTALFSIPVLGELLSWQEIIGAVIVLGGVYLVNARK